MFYDATRNDHGLPVDPLKAIIVPRPIGWISSLAPDGSFNLAPYSFFNVVAEHPPYVVYGSGGRKHSIANIEQTKEFVCNLTTWDQREQMNQTSATLPHGHDEFEFAGLAKVPSKLVKPPRVAGCPAALECRYVQTITLPGQAAELGYAVVLGQVLGIYIDDAFIKEGRVDTAAMKPIARLGYSEYAVVEDVFRMRRPD